MQVIFKNKADLDILAGEKFRGRKLVPKLKKEAKILSRGSFQKSSIAFIRLIAYQAYISNVFH